MRFYTPTSTDNVCSFGHGLECRLSSIPGAGNGLFATRSFRRNEYITFYDGEIIDRATANECKQKQQDTHIRCLDAMRTCIDGYTSATIIEGKGCGSLINDARRPERQNCRYHKANGIIWIRASRDIEAGEELFCSYGRTYWQQNR